MEQNISVEEVKEACKNSLHFLCTEMLGYKDWDNVHDDIEKFINRKSLRKMMLIPRGHLKTAIVTKGFSIQSILRNPDVRILIANQVWDKSREMLYEIKQLLTEKTDLAKLFGTFVSERWREDDIVVRQRRKALAAPTIGTSGVEAELTSSHYDIIILDDLQGEKNFQTPEQREKVKRYYRSMIDLIEPGGLIVVIGTRWHLDDVYQYIIDNESEYYDITVRRVIEDGKIIFPKKFNKKFDPKTKNWTAVDFHCTDYIDYLKKRPSEEFACTPAETPILMADWTTRPIEHIKVGDEILGYNLGAGKKNGTLTKTRVLRTFSKKDHVLKLKMESGRTVLCTKDHKWYTGRANDPMHKPYAPVSLGGYLRFVCPVEKKIMSESEKQDWSYLAGLFDGEGSTKSGGCLTLSQSSSKNPDVFSGITSLLLRLGISYGSYVRETQLNAEVGRRQSPGNTMFWIKDSFNVGLTLIRETVCAKKTQIAERFLKYGGKFSRKKDKVVDIAYDSYRTVYALETETGNYVAWGYASSNSQYMNDPIDSQNQIIKKEYFRYWDQRPPRLFISMTIDPAISEKQSADYFAIDISGMDQDYNIYRLDYAKGHWKVSEQIDNIFTMYNKWHPNAVGLETVAYQKALKSWLEEKMRERGVHFPITELRRSTNETKEFRIKSIEPFFREGKVFHAKWMKSFEDELLSFPKGKHDDEIDAFSSQLEMLIPGDSESVADLPTGSWEEAFQHARSSNKFHDFFHETSL